MEAPSGLAIMVRMIKRRWDQTNQRLRPRRLGPTLGLRMRASFRRKETVLNMKSERKMEVNMKPLRRKYQLRSQHYQQQQVAQGPRWASTCSGMVRTKLVSNTTRKTR